MFFYESCNILLVHLLFIEHCSVFLCFSDQILFLIKKKRDLAFSFFHNMDAGLAGKNSSKAGFIVARSVPGVQRGGLYNCQWFFSVNWIFNFFQMLHR